MSDTELLNPILLPLADNFEARGNGAYVEPSSLEEWEPLRAFLARLYAEGLISFQVLGRKMFGCQLTQKGYTTYLPMITALRALGA